MQVEIRGTYDNSFTKACIHVIGLIECFQNQISLLHMYALKTN